MALLEIYKTPSQLLLRVENLLSRYVRPTNNYCTMFDALFPALALLIIDSAHAQVSAPSCSNSSYSYNSLGQGPCLIVAYLAAVCNNGTFSISPLLPQHSYLGPNGPDNGDTCKCNTVAYSLISACDACQGGQWTSYSSWSYNCTSVATPGTFPDSIPAVTRVPYWAYLNPTGSGYWNESLAQIVGDSPEVTGSASNVPSSTRGQSTIAPGTSSRASSSSSKSNSNTGAIAGGVVGGVVGVALIAGLVAWFTIRRRQRHAPSADHISNQGSDMGVVPYPMDIVRPKLYCVL
ncbi:hypothetical protein F5888DRAFT_970217 [Russula emetica]|nr:hypothetical protein F5888DRAFT_970217 [Russula emetica]